MRFILLLLVGCEQVSVNAFPRYLALSADTARICGLRSDGDVECLFPTDATRPISDRLIGHDLVTYPRPDASDNCAVQKNTEIYCWSYDDTERNRIGTLEPPSGSFAAVSAGTYVSTSDRIEAAICGVRTSGAVSCVASDSSAVGVAIEKDEPEGSFVTAGIGFREACALSDRGTVHCWGKQSYEWIGTWDDLRCGYQQCIAQRGGTTLGSIDFGIIEADPFIDYAFNFDVLCLLRADQSVECSRIDPFQPYATIPKTELVSIVLEASTVDPTWVCGLTASGVPRCYTLPEGRPLPLLSRSRRIDGRQ